MLPQLSLFQQCSIQSQDVKQTWLHWRRQDALLVQNHFVALFHPKPNECLRFDLESCNLMCTYTVVTHPCHISPLAQARPMMLCIYTSNKGNCYATFMLSNKTHSPVELRGTRKCFLCTKSYISLSLVQTLRSYVQ